MEMKQTSKQQRKCILATELVKQNGTSVTQGDQWWGRKPFYLYVIGLNQAQVNTEQKLLMSIQGLEKMNPN